MRTCLAFLMNSDTRASPVLQASSAHCGVFRERAASCCLPVHCQCSTGLLHLPFAHAVISHSEAHVQVTVRHCLAICSKLCRVGALPPLMAADGKECPSTPARIWRCTPAVWASAVALLLQVSTHRALAGSLSAPAERHRPRSIWLKHMQRRMTAAIVKLAMDALAAQRSRMTWVTTCAH